MSTQGRAGIDAGFFAPQTSLRMTRVRAYKRKRVLADALSFAAQQVQDEHDDRYDEQDVDQPAADMYHEASQPEEDEDGAYDC